MSKINNAKSTKAKAKETKDGKNSKDKGGDKGGLAAAKNKTAAKAPAKPAPAKSAPAKGKPLAKSAPAKPAAKSAPAKPATKPVTAKITATKTVSSPAKPTTKIIAAKAAPAPAKPVTEKITSAKAAAVPAKAAAVPAKSEPVKSAALVPKAVPAKPVALAAVKAIATKTAPVAAKAVAKVTPVVPVITYKCPFPPDEVVKWRQILMARRHEITNDIAGLVKDAIDAEDGHTTPNHLAERGSDADLQDLSLGVAGDEKDIVWQIDRALLKIDSNRPLPFGLCEYNKTPIPRTRLQLIPFAPLSIEGATYMEQNSLMMEDMLIEY